MLAQTYVNSVKNVDRAGIEPRVSGEFTKRSATKLPARAKYFNSGGYVILYYGWEA